MQPEHRIVHGLQRVHPFRFGLTLGPGVGLWGMPLQALVKAINSSTLLGRQAALFHMKAPTDSATEPKKQRKQHSAGFKAKVALEALRGERTLNEVAGQFELHPTQVTQWKKRLVEGASGVFNGRADRAAVEESALRDRLYQEIGQLKVELDWLKKKHELLT